MTPQIKNKSQLTYVTTNKKKRKIKSATRMELLQFDYTYLENLSDS